jgi:hypothetical protein
MWIDLSQPNFNFSSSEEHLELGMHRISGRIIRPFEISDIRPDTGFDLPGTKIV